MNEKKCARYEELCSAAVDHALTEQEQKELDAHLAECPACRAYLEELRVMRELWKGLEAHPSLALEPKSRRPSYKPRKNIASAHQSLPCWQRQPHVSCSPRPAA